MTSSTWPEWISTQAIRRPFFWLWDALITFVTTYVSFSIPFSLVSSESLFASQYQEIALTLLFTADIFVSRIRLSKTQNVLLFEQTSHHSYYKRWIFFDVLAAIPFVMVFPWPILRLVRLFKLVKVVQLFVLLRRIKIHLANPLLLLQILYWTLTATHWLSCGWLLIRGLDSDVDMYTNYVGALYWTSTTLTTVGYGDIVPASDKERLYAVFTMILGYSLLGYLIGSIAGILTKKDPAHEKYHNSLEKLANAVKYAQLPIDLQQRIYDYYTYVFTRRVGYDEASFIEELPASLRAEVSIYFRKEVIERVSLFKNAPPSFVLEIAQHLTEHIVAPGDCIFRAGDSGRDMYLIARGEVGIYNRDETRRLRTLSEGDFFGEIALFKDIPRTATVRAETYCDLYTLSKNTFDRVFASYPTVASQIQAEAEQRARIEA